MSKKFLTNIELEAGLVDGSNSTGTSGFLLSSTGSATSWVDPAAVSVAESEQVHIACKNTSGVAISKGDPVYITGTVGTSFIVQIAKADASNSAKMPAVGLAETDLAINAEGYVIVSGVLKNITTDPLSTGDGTPSSNDTVYVKAGGGLTRTKPTGASNLIQNVGKVGRVQSTSAGSLAVSTIMRTNDVPNLNTGKIWVGSSTYTTESGVVHLDESNNRLGINNTSPLHALDVSGTIATDSGFLAVATLPSLAFIDSSGGGEIYTSTGSMYFKTGVGTPTIKMAILSGGNVGIGTTTPSEKLEVSGKILATGGQVRAGSYLESFPSFSFANDTDTGMFSDTANQLEFATAGSSRVIISSGGSVGIGTQPAYKLDVQGQIRLKNSNFQLIFHDTDSATDEWAITTFGNTGLAFYDGATSGSAVMTLLSGGNVGIGTTSPSRKFAVSSSGVIADFDSSTTSSYIDIVGTTAQLRAGVFGGVVGLANGTGTSAHLVLSSGGNVGIGTTSPSRALHVGGAGSLAIATLQRTNANTTGAIGALQWTASDDHSIASISVVGDGDNEGGHMDFRTTSAAANNDPYSNTNLPVRMRINSSGSVGIGTTTPSQKLEISDSSAPTIRIDNTKNGTWTAGEDFGGLEWYGNDASGEGAGIKGYIKLDSYNIYGAAHSMRFGTTDGTNGITERMVITHDGKVGIKATTPVANLHVGNGDGGSLFYINGQYNDVAFNGSTSGTNGVWSFINSATWDQTRFYVQDANNIDSRLTFRFTGNNGANEILTGTSTGKVGIGVTNPAERLEVAGNTILDASNANLKIKAGTTGTKGDIQWTFNTDSTVYASAGIAYDNRATDGFLIDSGYPITLDYASSYIRFSNNGSEKMRINTSGNVGIGTTNPGSKLQIGDTATTSNVAVRAISQQAYQAGFEAYGSGQGTGYMYVGQSLTYGGGVAYNGDGTPAAFDSGTTGADKITFFRRENSTDTAVMWYGYNSNDVNFRGDVIAYATSDEDLKDNINLIPNSIEKIKALRGVTFEWNEKSNKEIGKKEIGVIAQDVEKVLPEIVKTRDNGYKAVDYQKLTAVLIEAVKEQQKQIDELKAIINGGSK